MAWCPRCRLEYVSGIKVCPDCKTALVDELPDENDNLEEYAQDYMCSCEGQFESEEMCSCNQAQVDKNAVLEQIVTALKEKGLNEEEIQAVLANLKNSAGKNLDNYKPLSEKYEENKSGSWVLIACGAVGIIFFLLNALGVITLPLSGYSLWLTTIVMMGLFLIFIISGIRSVITAKKLAPSVLEEKEMIEKVVSFLKEQKDLGRFDINKEDFTMEELSLVYSNLALQACEAAFDDLPPGFAFYVTDRYYSEIFDED